MWKLLYQNNQHSCRAELQYYSQYNTTHCFVVVVGYYNLDISYLFLLHMRVNKHHSQTKSSMMVVLIKKIYKVNLKLNCCLHFMKNPVFCAKTTLLFLKTHTFTNFFLTAHYFIRCSKNRTGLPTIACYWVIRMSIPSLQTNTTCL